MRKIIVSERVTLDGFIAGSHGEMDWMEEFFDEALANYESELQKRWTRHYLDERHIKVLKAIGQRLLPIPHHHMVWLNMLSN